MSEIKKNVIVSVLLRLKITVSILSIILILLTSCISRLGRPMLTGTIVDFNKVPIEGCKVGETITDHNGNFILPESRYNKFLIPEIFYLEAPPLRVYETISKDSFDNKTIQLFNPYGGGLPKGTTCDLDTIYLKKSKSDFYKIVKNIWMVTTNTKMDTIYLIRPDSDNIFDTYTSYDDNYYKSQEPNNLPYRIIRKYITLDLKNNNTLQSEKIIEYITKEGYYSPRKANDTIQTSGKYLINDDYTIGLQSDFEELNGNYELIDFEYEYLVMKKLNHKPNLK